MKFTFSLLLLTAALGTGPGASAAVHASGQGLPLRSDVSPMSPFAPDAALTLIKDDCATRRIGNVAKAGTDALLQNGLITNGTAPMMKLN